MYKNLLGYKFNVFSIDGFSSVFFKLQLVKNTGIQIVSLCGVL